MVVGCNPDLLHDAGEKRHPCDQIALIIHKALNDRGPEVAEEHDL